VVAGGFAGAILYEIAMSRRVTRRAILVAVSGVAAALLALPVYGWSYHVAGNSMDFMAPMIGPAAMWTLKMQIGRFGYKSLYLMGPVAVAVLALAAFQYFKGRGQRTSAAPPDTDRIQALCWGFVVGNLVLYLKYPIEVSYLIPGLFFFLLIAGSTILERSRGLVIALLLAIASLNFVLPSFMEPNIPGRATGARAHFSWNEGTLVEDVKIRRLLIGCETNDCWNAHSPWASPPPAGR
jgi:hypothetical protein